MIQSIIHDLKSQDIQPDQGQLNLINNLISKYKVEKSIFNTLIKRGKKKGAYVWGDVGRGKTAIIKSFMKQISKKSTSYHYIDLMSDIGAGHTRFQQAHTILMRVNICLPYGQRVSIDCINEKLAFKRGTVTQNHWKGVE